ncbi:hydantoinase/oxoprolinase family protein [Mycobacterium lentiflavum]|uniref:Hydantoinase/oxoprolinase family protein n=1 Tax=Mycobacterium lentiflavum TaxID=141349 RepID=A0ABY3UPU3_MYCLN|nr:hydantoinase/oxoprolinase family protein [Mycobacterium lentiflavum]ULP41603.1 hydantoinase/oxoprolinase family protein [Mycobacterium lentiflavum]
MTSTSAAPTGGSQDLDGDGTGWSLGTDVGGTFTDLWLRSPSGRSVVCKSPTTPDVVTGVVNAVQLAADLVGIPVEELCQRVTRFGHGTTVGLNALLTGRAAKVALITTAGFGDVLEIGRLRRGTASLRGLELGDYFLRGRTTPLVPRDLVIEVAERVDSHGTIIVPLAEQSVRESMTALAEQGVEAVGICLLWATENPDHELAVARIVAQQLPRAFISVSHLVAPVVGEYARAATTVANAALGPVAGKYLFDLSRRLADLGMNASIMMTTSAGGVVPAAAATVTPVANLLSGPASCVVAGQALGRQLGALNVLTMDVGGTSFDVGVIVDGVPLLREDVTFGGADMYVPGVDIASIGAGGGSIATVNGESLTVGPQSAGADPGPVCYGKGGTLPTTTDADLVLGVLDPDQFGSGGIRLDAEAAAAAITEQIGQPLHLDAVAAARAIRVVFDAAMADLLRSVTIERGHDPREFILVVGGGSGPSHAWALCRELGMSGFIVPATATAQSAFGAGTSDLRTTASRTVYARILPGSQPNDELASLVQSALTETRNRALDTIPNPGQATVACTAALRYHGQAHHLDVEIDPQPTRADLTALLQRFEADYEKLFGAGSGFREAGFELLSVRAVASNRYGTATISASGRPLERVDVRPVVFDDPTQPTPTTVYRCDVPAAGQTVDGPCLIELRGCVVVVPPQGRAKTDELGLIHVEVPLP